MMETKKNEMRAVAHINFGVIVRGSISDIDRLDSFLQTEPGLRVIYAKTSPFRLSIQEENCSA